MQMYSTNHVGEIIRIIDAYTIIINAGYNRLKVGDTVQVYLMGEPLYNLDGSFLCNYEFIKDELDVIQTEELYSVCQKHKTIEQKFTLPLSPILDTFYQRESLKLDEGVVQKMPKYDKTVSIGDYVKLVKSLDN